MLALGLVHGKEWEPPDEPPAPDPGRSWRVPWRTVAWLAAAIGLMFLGPVADHAFGGLAGYLVLLLGVAVGLWRLERFCSGQYWRGLRDYQA
jgi:hypothetical protein